MDQQPFLSPLSCYLYVLLQTLQMLKVNAIQNKIQCHRNILLQNYETTMDFGNEKSFSSYIDNIYCKVSLGSCSCPVPMQHVADNNTLMANQFQHVMFCF